MYGGNSTNKLIRDNPNQYYSLNLGTIEIKQTRQSFYRQWNRLHRFQKTLVVLAVVIFVIYVLTHFQFHKVGLKGIPDKHTHEPLAKDKTPEMAIKESKEVVYQEEKPKPQIQPHKDHKVIQFKGPTNERQKRVVDMFQHAWKAYKAHAWGQDELLPISKRSSTWFNLGLTIVDSIDTIYIMNQHEQYNEARQWIAESLDLNADRYNNLFELTIRVLGGLMSLFHFTGDSLYLNKAYDLGNRTMAAFQTQSGIPYSDVNLARRTAKSPHWTSDSSISEVATIQLEYECLARATGDKRFHDVVSTISRNIHALPKQYGGLVPIYISTRTGEFVGSTITLGARGDSYYEYLLKQWIQLGAKFDPTDANYYLLEDWLDSMKSVRDTLIKQTRPGNLTFVGEMIGGNYSPKMDHLVCFLPGNMALGAEYLKKNDKFAHEAEWLMNMAESLLETCYQTYARTETGLSPEITYFNFHETSSVDTYIRDADRHNLLRPETLESLYYLHKLTKKPKYQEYGWKIFQSFENYTKVESGGYTSISDVTNAKNPKPRDKMESFFLAETIKYFYLLFEDEENIDLTKWVINTEAHPLPIYKATV